MKTMFGILGLLAVCATAVAFSALNARTDDTAALVKALTRSKHSLADGIKQVSKGPEAAISAKFEFDDNGKLSLSVYAAEKGLGADAEHNVLEEYGGSPEQAAWTPEIEIFKDVTHVARSAQQQTLMALTTLSLLDVVARAEKETKGQVLSITPVLEGRKAFFVLRVVSGDKVVESKYGLFGDEDDEENEGHEKHEKH
jgi:hypothetical protein